MIYSLFLVISISEVFVGLSTVCCFAWFLLMVSFFFVLSLILSWSLFLKKTYENNFKPGMVTFSCNDCFLLPDSYRWSYILTQVECLRFLGYRYQAAVFQVSMKGGLFLGYLYLGGEALPLGESPAWNQVLFIIVPYLGWPWILIFAPLVCRDCQKHSLVLPLFLTDWHTLSGQSCFVFWANFFGFPPCPSLWSSNSVTFLALMLLGKLKK